MKRLCFLFLALTGLFALVGFGQERAQSRASFTSQPSGATVFVDDANRGTTPLMLFDIGPGRHHVKYRLNGYVDRDVFVSVNEGQALDHDEVLEVEKGLLLLTTEPSRCNIRVDGVSVGETPRFIGNLSAGETHTVRLSKAGYIDQTISVKFNGREPLVRDEKLVMDSGVVNVVSEPSGAAVTVNGIGRGVTPVLVRDIPRGTAVVKLTLDGYREETREIKMNPGDEQTMSVSLDPLPGTLHLLSDPPRASFYVNDEPRGLSPLSISGLKPGDYVVRCEMSGYGAVTRTVTIRNGEAAREEFKLSSVRGRIELRTKPAGAEVLLDGHRVGVTKSSGGGEDVPSETLSIEDVAEGEHSIIIRKEGYAEVSKKLNLKAMQTAKNTHIVLKRLFEPNIEIETDNGIQSGIFKSQDDKTIVIETKTGTLYPIPRSCIRKVRYL